MSKAVIYTRVSTAAQGQDGTSLAAQAAACQKKAAEIGAHVVAYHEETLSGGLYLARPGIQQALQAIEGGQADTLIIYRLDRTGREVDALRDIRRRVEAAGGKLVFADGMSFEQNAVGNLMFTQLGAFAEFERELIRERCVRGLRAKAESGKMPAVGFSPYGYRVVRKSDIVKGTHPPGSDGTYELVESEKHLPPLIFEQYVKLQSLRRVAAWLAENGYTTRQGRLWKPNVIRQIILNPVYKGEPQYGKKRRHVDEARLEEGKSIEYHTAAPEGEQIVMSAPALISKELWEEANKLLREGRQKRSVPRERRWPLSTLVHCPRCGRRMYAQRRRGRTSTSEREHKFYCAGVYPYTPGHPLRCEKVSYAGLTIEGLTIEAVLRLLDEPELMQDAIREYQAHADRQARKAAQPAETKRLQREIERLAKRERGAAEAALEARLSGSDGAAYEQIRAEAEAERLGAEKRLALLQRVATESTPAWRADMRLAGAARQVLLSKHTSAADKCDLLGQIVECVYPIPAGERGSAKRGHYRIGGVSVVLRSSTPLLVIHNVITKRGAHGAATATRIEFRAYADDPFPRYEPPARFPMPFAPEPDTSEPEPSSE